MAQRVLVDTAAELTAEFPDQDGEPSDPGPTTVEVERGDGTVLLPAGTATSGSEAERAVALTAAQNDRVDLLKATWAKEDGSTLVTFHEVVGGFLCSISEISAMPEIGARFTKGQKLAARAWFEGLVEAFTGRAWVRRYRQESVAGGRPALLSGWPVLAVRWATLDGAALDVTNWTFDGGAVADPSGRLPLGTLVVGYEHGGGLDQELHDAALIAIADKLKRDVVGRPMVSRTDGLSGVTERFASVRDDSPTGIPEVDSVLRRRRTPVVA